MVAGPGLRCTDLSFGDGSQFAWDSDFALHGRANLLNATRNGAARSEPIANLIRYHFDSRHAWVVLVAFVYTIAKIAKIGCDAK